MDDKHATFFVKFLTNIYFNDIVAHTITAQETLKTSSTGMPAHYVDRCHSAAAAYIAHVDKFFEALAKSFNDAQARAAKTGKGHFEATTGIEYERALVRAFLPSTYHDDIKQSELRRISKRVLETAMGEANAAVTRIADDIVKLHTSERRDRDKRAAAHIGAFQSLVWSALKGLKATLSTTLRDKAGSTTTMVSSAHFEKLREECYRIAQDYAKLLVVAERLKEQNIELRERLARGGVHGGNSQDPSRQQPSGGYSRTSPLISAPMAEPDKPAPVPLPTAANSSASMAAAVLESFDDRIGGLIEVPAMASSFSDPIGFDSFDTDKYTEYDDMLGALNG